MRIRIIIILCFLLTGCSSLTAPTPTTPGFTEYGMPLGNHNLSWQQRQQQLATLTNWSADGAVAAHSTTKGWNASFNWQQNINNYQVQLFGPLGMGRVQLAGGLHSVTLQTANGKVYAASNPEALMQQRLGWQLPVSNLYYWLRGLPAPSHLKYGRSFDMNHHISLLKQNGWQIIYLRYVSVNGIDLPDRMLISNKDWQIRIVVKQWKV